MLKFLFGVATGVVLVFVLFIVVVLILAGMRTKPPSVASGSTLVLRLEGGLPERALMESPLVAFGQKQTFTVRDTWSMLNKAAADKRIRAVVVEPYHLEVGWGKMEELHAEIEKVRRAGKPVYAYLKTPGTREYYVATAASRVFMAPEDMLNLKGLRFELMYFRHTLDKLGVTVDVEHAGKYKDFMDMFTRSDMSPETREVLTSVLDRLYGDLVKTIGVSRRKTAAEIQDAIDNGPLLSAEVAKRGLVDGLCYEEEMFGKLAKETQTSTRKMPDRDYARVTESDAGVSAKHTIAFVAADGEITRGDPESSSLTDEGIEAESFDRLLNKVASSNAKAVIVRIDSPGGEVFASDAIWKAMTELRKKKPVIVSMSDTAASGGYYMAMNKAPIVAYPGTLTGSIGVTYGKPVLKGLYDKLGIDKDGLQRGRFAGIDSDYHPLDAGERAKLREGIDENYQMFVQKVADSRRRSWSDIDRVAQGRVWLGDQAKENGLVDELGGIDRAIEMVKAKAGIPSGDNVRLVPYPARRSWFDLLAQTPQAETEGDSAILRWTRPFRAQAGLPPVRETSAVRMWLHGGFLSVSPWRLAFQ